MMDEMNTGSTAEYLDRSAAAFKDQLALMLKQGVSLGTDPEILGRRAAGSVMAGRRWAEDVGPFYDTDGARAALGGVTKQAVSDRVRRGALLGLPLRGDGAGRTRLVYPVWQFDVLDSLHEVLPRAGYDVERPAAAWTVATWLTTPDARLDGLAPVAMLRAGHAAAVLVLAAEVAASLGVDERRTDIGLQRAG
jgi:hypothetical protein